MQKFFSTIYLALTLLFITSNIMADEAMQRTQHMQELQKLMQQMQAKMKENPNMSKAERKALVQQMIDKSEMGRNTLKRQKEQMPKMLQILKSNRACLEKAQTKTQLKTCEEKSKILAKELGMKANFDDEKEYKDFVWNEKEKKMTLERMDKGIRELEKVLPCIQKAQTLSDVKKCR